MNSSTSSIDDDSRNMRPEKQHVVIRCRVVCYSLCANKRFLVREGRYPIPLKTRVSSDVAGYHMDFTCAILAGGKSTRMGTDKATLKVCNKALIQQVYEKAQHVFKDILIISNHHDQFYGINCPIIRDILPIQSSIVGIASALLSASTPYVFILACDMPFVSVQSIECVLKNVHGEDIIIPHTRKGFEPLHAVYNRSCISVLLTRIGRQQLKVTDLFPFFSVREIGEHPDFMNRGTSVFTNINVVEDLSLAQRLGNG